MTIDQPTAAHFHAGFNMPGYLPEMSPGTFVTFAEAKDYMIWELGQSADAADSWVEGDCDDDIPCGVHGEDCGHDVANTLSAEAEDLNLDNGPDWSTVAGNLAYWINACTDDSCELDSDAS